MVAMVLLHLQAMVLLHLMAMVLAAAMVLRVQPRGRFSSLEQQRSHLLST
jgi:hypothetical protein